MDDRFYLIIKTEEGKAKTKSKEESEAEKKSKDVKKWKSLGEDAVGYIPGVGDVQSVVSQTGGLINDMSMGGATAWVAGISLAMSLAKKAYDVAIKVREERVQQTELRRRAGYTTSRNGGK